MNIILKKDNCLQEAIEEFSYCINNNVNIEKALEYRSYCFSMLKMYKYEPDNLTWSSEYEMFFGKINV